MTLKLEVGKIYVDKQGSKVRILCTDSNVVIGGTKFPVVGLRSTGNSEKPATYTLGGCFFAKGGFDFDLVKEYVPLPEKKKVFIILWHHKNGQISATTDQTLVSANYYYTQGWVPVKGFEVEYDVPQPSN